MDEAPDPEAEPVDDERRKRIEEAIAGILELRKRTGKITIEEILSARDEGRR